MKKNYRKFRVTDSSDLTINFVEILSKLYKLPWVDSVFAEYSESGNIVSLYVFNEYPYKVPFDSKYVRDNCFNKESLIYLSNNDPKFSLLFDCDSVSFDDIWADVTLFKSI